MLTHINISWWTDLVTYEFDGDLLIVKQIRPLKDHTKRPFPNLLPYPIVDAHDVR